MSGQPTEQDREIRHAVNRIPSGLFVLTAEYEQRRTGMVTSFVQQVCVQPLMVCVAIAKGQPIMPLVSESRRFGLCQLAQDDKVILRKFSNDADLDDDPFLGFELMDGRMHGVPLLANTLAQMHCELTCHMDVEGDHDLFVGHVVAGAHHPDPDRKPLVHWRDQS